MLESVNWEAVHRNAAREYEALARRLEAQPSPGDVSMHLLYLKLAADRKRRADEVRDARRRTPATELESC